MGKHSNGLIIFSMIVIVLLLGIYYMKTTGNYSYLPNIIEQYREENYEGTRNKVTNKNSIVNVNEGTIGNVNENTSIYNTQKGYKFNNRYYYNELDECSKAMYDAIVNNLDRIKQGKCEINIDYDFNTILSSPNGSELLNDYYNDAINAINLDIPNLFYLDFLKLYINVETTKTVFSTKYRVFIDSKDYPNFFVDNFSTAGEVSSAIAEVESLKQSVIARAGGNDYDKLKTVHDWIVNYMEYDSSSLQKATVYGGLVERKGVCEAYSRIYKYILDEIGIENILVTGTGTNSDGETEEHMWNYVKLYGNWYAVDVTWDDPIIIGGGTLGKEHKYKYFLVRKCGFL